MIKKEYDKMWSGDVESLKQLPVESLMPVLMLKHMGSIAQTMNVLKEHIEYGFDPDVTFGRKKPSDRKMSMLKDIASEFSQTKEGEDKAAIQLIVDENLINTYLLEFVMIDNSMSLKQYLKLDPRTRGFATQMNTRLLQPLFPDLYANSPAKPFDLLISMSHNLVKDKLEGQKMTGFALDSKGNFRFTLNIYVQILVDKSETEKVNEREIFLGLTYKGKLVVNEENGARNLLIVHKSAEVSNAKILNSAGEEVVVEQMLITSALNVQLEKFISMVPPSTFPLQNPPNPKELDCLGFNLSDLSLEFKKGYLEIKCGYKTVKEPRDKKVCDNFISMMRKGPGEMQTFAQDFMEKKREIFDNQHDELPGKETNEPKRPKRDHKDRIPRPKPTPANRSGKAQEKSTESKEEPVVIDEL